MNHRKIILVGCISAFVAITTALLGVTGTIIGSVLSSVLYNVLSEILEKPVKEAKITNDIQTLNKLKSTLEYEIAYIFPLVVIAVIQLLLLLSFLSEWGLLPDIFLNTYLLIQDLVNNNLYRIMGISLLVISIYPFILKSHIIKKSHGLIVGIVGLIFIARGFVDLDNSLTNIYSIFFQHFDFEIELIAFILITIAILKILISAKQNQKKFTNTHHIRPPKNLKNHTYTNTKKRQIEQLEEYKNLKNHLYVNPENKLIDEFEEHRKFKSHIRTPRPKTKQNNYNINESSQSITFESNEFTKKRRR